MHVVVKEQTWWKDSSTSFKTFAGEVHSLLWKKNKNAMVVFVGDPGSGKSYAAISTACAVDPNFSVEKIVYTPKDFLKALDNARRGDIIIWDEAGVGIPAREWNTIQNKVISYVLQTFRFQNIGVFFTTPGSALLDKIARILIHYQVKVLGYNKETRDAVSVVYQREYDPVRDTLEWKKWQVDEDGKVIDPNPVFVPYPPEGIVKEYEKTSREYKQKVREEAISAIENYEKGVSSGIDGRTLRKLQNQADVLKRAYLVFKNEHGLSDRQIALKLQVSPQTLNAWKTEWGIE